MCWNLSKMSCFSLNFALKYLWGLAGVSTDYPPLNQRSQTVSESCYYPAPLTTGIQLQPLMRLLGREAQVPQRQSAPCQAPFSPVCNSA